MAGSIVIILLVLVFLGIPVAAVLGVLSLVLDAIYQEGRLSVALGEFVWDKSKEFILVVIPMFILLGEIMLRRHRPTHVQRRNPMGVLAARRSHARKYRVVRNFCGLLRVKCCNSCNRWHSGLSRDYETRLQ